MSLRSHRRRGGVDSIAIALLLILAISACDRAKPRPADSPVTVATQTSQTPTVPGPSEPVSPQPHDAGFVLPGAFAPDTTVADLQQRYGKANVRIGELPGAEGEVHRGVELFAGDPQRQAYVYFQDETALRGLSLVSIDNVQSRWRLESGVHIGMSLAELVALNGAPIVFTGFGWDYGGYISDWSSGKLADGAVRAGVRLSTRDRAGAHEDSVQASYPIGDEEFRSDDPAYPKLGEQVVVGQISVSFPGEDDL